MNQEKTTLEVIAPTVEEAIAQGLEQLGLPRERVEIEVLDSGSRGIFGIGNRQARVRLRIVSDIIPDGPVAVKSEVFDSKTVDKIETKEEKTEGESSDINNIEEVARSVVEELLERMRVHASVDAKYVQSGDEKDFPYISIDIRGKDLSILIGRRSETLNALQYISNLIISKELGNWIPVTLDVQGYRERRERQLRKLALRLADQVVQTGRRQTLEPMPANERRLIHIALREHPKVVTESVGEEPNRKVTIIPKK